MDGTQLDYASANGGTSTFLNFNFGAPVTFDRTVMVTRDSPASNDRFTQVTLGFDVGSETIATNSAPGRSDIYSLSSPVTTQTVTWDVDAIGGVGAQNTGMMEMIYLNTPDNTKVVAGVTAYNSATPYNANYVAANAANGVVGFSGQNPTGIEYASAGLGAGMFVDFDLGETLPIAAFDYIDRFTAADRTTNFDLIFSNDAAFSTIIDTLSFSKGGLAGSGEFDPIFARYVRLDATTSAGNSGVSEFVFYSAVPEPTSIAVWGVMGVIVGFGFVLRRRRKKVR